ncbi:MAG: ATP-dependent helicase [Candidatus Marinimicrobia bacterium]|nr:ATP-dependent helicase [Candidatus Neomarinimicrobiota bacterium]
MANYSNDQIKALESFQTFLDHDANIMIIKGTAGSGKTTLIKQFSKICKENGWRFIPLGVWGRSSSAITQITGLPAVTVAKYIFVNKRIENGELVKSNGEPYEDFNDWFKGLHLRLFSRAVDAIQKFFSNEEEELKGDLLVVDEASCLNDRELANLTDLAINNSLEDIKIVFIGDDCQLPPVAQSGNKSNGLVKEYMESELGLECYPEIELVESHRAAEGPLFELGQKLRPMAKANENGNDARRSITGSINNKEILGYGEDAIIKVCKEVFTDNPDEVIFITDSNLSCLEWARKLRKEYFSEPFSAVVVGERLRSDSNGLKDVILKGDEFEVLEVLDADVGDFYILKVREVSRRQEYSGWSILQRLDNLFDVFKANREFNIAVYKTVFKDDDEMLSKGLWRKIEEKWDELGWENEERERTVHDITWCRYSYTSTVYSAQGGEWDTVVLNVSPPSRSTSDIARYWYTAATRAKKQLLVMLG